MSAMLGNQIEGFEARFSLHEGGTKYYQVITLMNAKNRKGVVITHWGAYHPGATFRPRNHGQSKIETIDGGSVSAIRNAVISGKTKRGYGPFRAAMTLDRHSTELSTESARIEFLEQWLKPEKVSFVVKFMTDVEDFSSRFTGVTSSAAPTVERTVESIAIEELSRPASTNVEHWGTW